MSGKRTNGRIAHTKKKNTRKQFYLSRLWGAHDAFELRLEFGSIKNVPFMHVLKLVYTQKRVNEIAYPSHSVFARLSIPT